MKPERHLTFNTKGELLLGYKCTCPKCHYVWEPVLTIQIKLDDINNYTYIEDELTKEDK